MRRIEKHGERRYMRLNGVGFRASAALHFHMIYGGLYVGRGRNAIVLCGTFHLLSRAGCYLTSRR